MQPQLLFGVQFTMSLLVFGVVAKWYISPALDRLPMRSALVPLFLVHALRYLPSSAFAPGQVASDAPRYAMEGIAYGDLGSAVLALIAVAFLRYDWPRAIAVAWLVNVVMSLDWLNASYLAASSQLVSFGLGGNWYIVSYYVPVIGVIHVMIFLRLLRGR